MIVRMVEFLLVACLLSSCGCVAQKPPAPPEIASPAGYAIYTERSQTDAAALTPDDAKAILVAQAAGVDLGAARYSHTVHGSLRSSQFQTVGTFAFISG
jgi:hypothetical protein